MKKLSFLVVAGAMMAFASCGNNEATENATAPEMSVSTENASDNATATEAPATEAAPAAKTEAKTK